LKKNNKGKKLGEKFWRGKFEGRILEGIFWGEILVGIFCGGNFEGNILF
jgi:hypothetical protein